MIEIYARPPLPPPDSGHRGKGRKGGQIYRDHLT